MILFHDLGAGGKTAIISLFPMSYFGCEGVHVFLQVVHGLIDSSRDGGENRIQTGLCAETGHHLNHCV